MTHSHAWVESPLQFLSALEARRSHEQLTVHIRTDASGMTDFVTRYDPSWLPKEVTVTSDPSLLHTALSSHADRLLIGDLCSGMFQKMLARRGVRLPSQLVLVDDGLATQRAVGQLSARWPVPLSRARQSLSTARKGLALATAIRIRSMLRRGRLKWTTALLVSPELEKSFTSFGGSIERHRFTRLRELPGAVQELPDRLILGSAMVSDGLVHRADYLEWVSRAASGEKTAYFAHRRETAGDLATIAELPGVTVHTSGLPVEISLAHAPAKVDIFSLPTSAVTTLPLIMDEPRCHVTAIASEWWTGRAPDSLRTELNRAAATAGLQ